MEYIEIPEIRVLRGKKAIKALHDFIDEVEEQRGKELTQKQTTALIKLAKELISSIETETRSGTSHKNIKEMRSSTVYAHLRSLFPIRAT